MPGMENEYVLSGLKAKRAELDGELQEVRIYHSH